MKLPIKQLVAAGIIGTIGVAGLATSGIANADTSDNANTDPMSSLVDKIASTFNLDKSKVQQVFDTERSEREAAREQERNERLQSLVDQGTITEAQKTAIEKKLEEMKADRGAMINSMKDLSDEERKTAMDEKRDEMETWAEEQGLDLRELKGVLGGHGARGGFGGPRSE